ncbi:MAG: rod shape-determining protein MreC [Myxococcales bacterium]|nr:rod shape-determining protein MreC [Myxococcales bacterium]
MLRFFKQYRVPLAVLAVILLPLLVYRAHSVRPGRANTLDKLVLAATAPLRALLMNATGAVSDAWYHYVDVVGARAENADLRLKIQGLEHEVDRLETLGVENAELRRLLVIKAANPEVETRVAQVIGMSISPSARTLEIDQGSLHGIPQGAPVVSGQGLVGLVQRVAWTSSEVLLIADEKMSLHAQVVRTRARGRIRGQGLSPDFRLELTEILRSDDLVVGDRVVTSGLGKVFPKGLPIGEVIELRTEPGVQHRVADVAPYVDFARLERVSVLIQKQPGDPIVTPEPLLPPSLRAGAETATVAAP